MELVCFNVNEFTPEVRFLASLSDGRTVIEDCNPAHNRGGWLRLQQFLKDHPDIFITGLRLQKGEKVFTVPSHQQGYFYCKKAMKIVLGGRGEAWFTGIGYYNGSTVDIEWFKMPNLDSSSKEQRSKGKAGLALIEKP